MAPGSPRLKVLSVGGNPVSAFLSWRLQATNACDVTLVWKSGYEHVAQYGISFKSQVFGNERFKPRYVVRAPEDAANARDGGSFDYVILCVKALPDVYDLAAVIDSVVTPQHTCILVNTTHSLGIEAAVEERFPTNVVLSLVAGAELSQLAQSEFEHKGSTDIWVGPANKNDNIPSSIQDDMAQALAMTLSTGQVDCRVSSNIRQQQYERMIGPIAFHPVSVIFEMPNLQQLIEKVGVKDMISGVIDELLSLADYHGCKFAPDFKQKTIEDMTRAPSTESIMWQDFRAKRPMEVETFLGSPIKLAQEAGKAVPRIETLYSILFHLNIANRQRPRNMDDYGGMPPSSPTVPPLVRMSPSNVHLRSSAGGFAGGGMPRPRPRNSSSLGPRRPPPMKGGAPPNGWSRPPMNGGGDSRQTSRRGSMEETDLEEFSHLVVYDDIPEGGEEPYPDASDAAFRDQEMQMRNRKFAMRQQEMRMRPQMGPRGPPRRPMRSSTRVFDDEDDDDDDFDQLAPYGPPLIDPDSFDMMSVTSRKNRKGPSRSAAQVRDNPEGDFGPQSRGGRFRPAPSRNNRSSQLVSGLEKNMNIFDSDLLGYSSNRYGTVDRGAMKAGSGSRANSLTTGPPNNDMGYDGTSMMMGANGAMPRRASQSPGNPYSPSLRGGNGRPSLPSMNGRPSPPDMVKQPTPRYPQDQGDSTIQRVEQHVGVSNLPPQPSATSRNLTGIAGASIISGDAVLEPNQSSIQVSHESLSRQPPIGVW